MNTLHTTANGFDKIKVLSLWRNSPYELSNQKWRMIESCLFELHHQFVYVINSELNLWTRIYLMIAMHESQQGHANNPKSDTEEIKLQNQQLISKVC